MVRRARRGTGRWVVAVGDGSRRCSGCGSDRLERRRLAWRERAGRWLAHGRPVAAEEVRCRRCGATWLSSGHSGSSAYLARVHGGGGWRLPLALLEVVKRQRTWQPNPALYLGAAAAGTAVGVAARAVARVPWWLGSALGPAAVFVLSAVGALRNPWHDLPLRVELLSVLDPQRYLELTDAADEERLRTSTLPLYGLAGDAWFRFASGTTRRGRDVDAVELAHRGSIDDDQHEVRVETRRSQRDPRRAGDGDATIAEGAGSWERGALVHWLAHEGGPGEPQPPAEEDLLAWHQRWQERSQELVAQLSGRPWRPRRFAVGEQLVTFETLALDAAWVATAHLGDVHVNLRVRGVAPDELRLALVDDLEPYLAGRRQLRGRHRPQ